MLPKRSIWIYYLYIWEKKMKNDLQCANTPQIIITKTAVAPQFVKIKLMYVNCNDVTRIFQITIIESIITNFFISHFYFWVNEQINKLFYFSFFGIERLRLDKPSAYWTSTTIAYIVCLLIIIKLTFNVTNVKWPKTSYIHFLSHQQKPFTNAKTSKICKHIYSKTVKLDTFTYTK